MLSPDKITETILKAADELNNQLPEENKLELNEDTILYGLKSKLDSLGLVSLLIAVEQRFQDEHGRSIELTDEKALSQESSPFRSVRTLSEYIYNLLN